MQKKRYLLAILLFIIPSAYGIYQEVAVSGWVNSSGSLTSDDDRTFRISLMPGNLKVLVHLPTGDSLTVKNDSCEIINSYDICFSESKFSYHDYEEDRDYYKAKVWIYDLIANLVLTRTIDNLDLLINEEANIDVTITNSGEIEATNIKFTDRIPSPFVITDISGCKIYGDEIIWEGSLRKLQNQECSYTIKATANISYESEASVSYFNGIENKEVDSDSIEFDIPDYQLRMIANLSKDTVKKDGKVNLNIKWQNNHSSYPISVENFYIDIPIDLEISNTPKLLNRQYNKFTWHGTLKTGEEKESNIELKAKKEEYYKIKIHAEYIINNIRKTIEKFLTLNEHLLKTEEEDITQPVEENTTTINLNTTSDIINETTEANETDITENTTVEIIPTTQPETEKSEEKETIISEKVEIGPLIKKICASIFNKPAFIVIDAILFALIVIIIINIKKHKKKIE